jgi:hypothetical protein
VDKQGGGGSVKEYANYHRLYKKRHISKAENPQEMVCKLSFHNLSESYKNSFKESQWFHEISGGVQWFKRDERIMLLRHDLEETTQEVLRYI